MSLNEVLSKYRSRINEVSNILEFAYRKNSDDIYICSEEIQVFIAQNAFLNFFVAWEEFLEMAFVQYLMGEESIDGTIVNCYAQPSSYEHAYNMIIGTQKYFDWGNPELVRKISKLYFENGNPFYTVISSINTELLDLRTIRNATAHISTTTQRKLDSCACRLLDKQVNKITVVELIFTLDPNSNDGLSIYDNFRLKLDIVAENIAKCII